MTPGVAGSDPAFEPRDLVEDAAWEREGRTGVLAPGAPGVVAGAIEALRDDAALLVADAPRRSNGFRWSVALGVVWSWA